MNRLIRLSREKYIVTSDNTVKENDVFYLPYKSGNEKDFYVCKEIDSTNITTTSGDIFEKWKCKAVLFSTFPIEEHLQDFGDGLKIPLFHFNKVKPFIVINHLDNNVTLNGDRKYTINDLERISVSARQLKLDDGAHFNQKKFVQDYIDKNFAPYSEWNVEILDDHIRIITFTI